MANLSARVLVAATTDCIVRTQAPHLSQEDSPTTVDVGGAGRGWQMLSMLQESWPALQVQTCTVMSAEHMGMLASVQSLSLKQVPGCEPASSKDTCRSG
jgi:hypothetical protein